MGPASHKPRTGFDAAPKCCSNPFSNISLVLIVVLLAGVAYSADQPDRRNAPLQAAYDRIGSDAIVVGFVGGFVHRTDRRHSTVQLAQKLSAEYGGRAHVGIYENHRREDAFVSILRWLDRDGDGGLSDSEKRQARIVLYGHSWGGSAVVALARQLKEKHIPVLLTIQVDSIAKPGIEDRTIPANVVRAVNFYQTRGPLHGVPEIVAADPASTQILGDFRFEYKQEPAPCSAYPWFARHFFKGHTSIECDPNVWSRVEELITQTLSPAKSENQSASNTF